MALDASTPLAPSAAEAPLRRTKASPRREAESLGPPSADRDGDQEDLATDLAAQHFVRLLRALLRKVYALDPDDPTSTDLPVAQLRLSTLLGEGPRTVSGVAKDMRISLSGVTQLVRRLESAGLVQRLVEDGDRRVRRLALTDRGIELVRRRSERRVQSARQLLAKLPPAQRRAALDTLSMLAEETT